MATEENCNFSYPHYRNMLLQARALGFGFAGFDGGVFSQDSVILLRHDIDLDMQKALAMARLEADLGVKSTYFLLLSAPFYNLFERSDRQAARDIAALGHDVGLHFDTEAYPTATTTEWASLIEAEAKVLAAIIGRPVTCVSFHRPCPELLNMEFDGITSAYATRYFSGLKYLSDSGMRWREGCLCGHLQGRAVSRYQILIHPFWWGTEPRGGLIEMLQSFEEAKRRSVRAHLEANISAYRSALLQARGEQWKHESVSPDALI